MTLIQTVGEFCQYDDKADRAIFEAAMIKRLQEKEYRMADLMYEVYCTQRDLKCLEHEVVAMRELLDKPKAKAKDAK